MQPGLSQPPFQIVASAMGLLSPAEMDSLIAGPGQAIAGARLGTGGSDTRIRRSQTVFLKPDEHRWLYDRLWDGARDFNQNCFGVEITGIRDHIQLARYDASDQGFYDWHMDFGPPALGRKISISVQLSDPADYDGGDLEFSFGARTQTAERTRGMTIAFPSFAIHRVTPVTRGVRWSLVAWVAGPRWR